MLDETRHRAILSSCKHRIRLIQCDARSGAHPRVQNTMKSDITWTWANCIFVRGTLRRRGSKLIGLWIIKWWCAGCYETMYRLVGILARTAVKWPVRCLQRSCCESNLPCMSPLSSGHLRCGTIATTLLSSSMPSVVRKVRLQKP
jgi:hypothetical protein